MGGWICLTICLLPIYFFHGSGHTALMVLSILNAAINSGSVGVMYYCATVRNSLWAEQVQKNRELEEGPLGLEEEITLHKIATTKPPEDVPDWLVYVNAITTVIAIALRVIYWVIK